MADFKAIKRDLQDKFKAVKKSLKEGRLPDLETVETFVALAGETADALPKGREMADNFKAQAAALLEAVEAGRIEAAEKAYGFLKGMRAACHKKYK